MTGRTVSTSSSVYYNRVVIAIKRCIVATFDQPKWNEFGYFADCYEIINSHPRLLRSLGWGDLDYEDCVLDIIPKIIGESADSLRGDRFRIVEEFIGLRDWLRNSDADLYAAIYIKADGMLLDDVEEAVSRLDVAEFNRHVARIRTGIQSDPEQAIGSAKELLESVLKAIVGLEGERSKEEIPALIKKARRVLDLDPNHNSSSAPGADIIRRTLSNLGQIVTGVYEVRNLYGTGHGRYRSSELEIAHARLVVNAAVTIAAFLLDVAHEREILDSS